MPDRSMYMLAETDSWCQHLMNNWRYRHQLRALINLHRWMIVGRAFLAARFGLRNGKGAASLTLNGRASS